MYYRKHFIKIKYCKYIGYNQKLFDFISENIESIKYDDLIDSIVDAGFDFAEQLLIHFKNNNKNPNEIIFSLVNKSPAFIDIISYLSDKYKEIRDTIDSIKVLSSNNSHSTILSVFKTILDKSKEKDNKIKELESELDTRNKDITALNDELTKLRNENIKLKQDNSNQNEELIRLRTDDLSQKDEIEKLKRENASKSEEITSLRSENTKNIDFIEKIGEFLPKIKKIKNIHLTELSFNEVYNIMKEASNERDLTTILYYHKILESIAKPQMGNLSVFLSTSKRGDIQLTKDFIECGENIYKTSGRQQTLIHLFADEGNTDAIKYLMKYNFDVNQKDVDGNTPLHLAVMNNHYSTCKCLCSQPKISLNIKNNVNESPLDIATRRGYNLIVDLLNIY